MRFYLLVFFTLCVVACKAENRFPAQVLKIMGWSNNDQSLIFFYSRLSRDLDVTEAPSPSTRTNSVYRYTLNSAQLVESAQLSDSQNNAKKLNNMFYHAGLDTYFYEFLNIEETQAELSSVDLNANTIAFLTSYPKSLTSAYRISISPDGYYGHLFSPTNGAYDFNQQKQFILGDPLSLTLTGVVWFQDAKQTLFSTGTEVYSLDLKTNQSQRLQSISWSNMYPSDQYIPMGFKDSKILYYLQVRDQKMVAFIERNWETGVIQSYDMGMMAYDGLLTPECLNHAGTKLVYMESGDIYTVSTDGTHQQKHLNLKNAFPVGGTILAPPTPTENIF